MVNRVMDKPKKVEFQTQKEILEWRKKNREQILSDYQNKMKHLLNPKHSK